jgi:hypothetical protein
VGAGVLVVPCCLTLGRFPHSGYFIKPTAIPRLCTTHPPTRRLFVRVFLCVCERVHLAGNGSDLQNRQSYLRPHKLTLRGWKDMLGTCSLYVSGPTHPWQPKVRCAEPGASLRDERGGGMSVERAASGMAVGIRIPDSLAGGGRVAARTREGDTREGGGENWRATTGGLGAEQTREWRACQGFEFWFENSSGVLHQPKVNVDSKLPRYLPFSLFFNPDQRQEEAGGGMEGWLSEGRGGARLAG